MKKLLLALCIAILACMPVLAWDTEEQNRLSMETGGYFKDSVRNDNTGRWREFIYHDATIKTDDFAERYYRAYFHADDEVHIVFNKGSRETTRILYAVGNLFVTTFTYVDGEENDANAVPGGDMLRENILEIPANDYTVEAPPESAVEANEEEPADDAKYVTKKKIKKLQKALKERGYYSGKATGKLDEETRTAIRKYQASNGMETTGLVTKELYKALV